MSEPEVDLFDLQSEVAQRIDSYTTNYAKTSTARFNLGYLLAREKGLNDLWAEFVVNHKAIVAETSADERKSNDFFVNAVFNEYEAIYFDFCGRICEKRLQLSAPPSLPSSLPPSLPSSLPSSLLSSLPSPSAILQPQPGPSQGLPQADFASHPAAAAPIPDFPVQPNAMVHAHHIQIPRLNVPTFNGAYEDRFGICSSLLFIPIRRCFLYTSCST